MAAGSMITWPDFPECLGENFNHETVRRIKDNPKKWLASLPMFEYAYMVIMTGIHRYGHRVEDHVDEIFETLLLPILNEYHKALMHYRVFRMLYMRKYANDLEQLEAANTTLQVKYQSLKCLTRDTRAKLRAAVHEYATNTKTTTDDTQETG